MISPFSNLPLPKAFCLLNQLFTQQLQELINHYKMCHYINKQHMKNIKLEHNVDQIYKGYLLFSMTLKNFCKITPNPQKNFSQQLKDS
jgi:hypothetical protein